MMTRVGGDWTWKSPMRDDATPQSPTSPLGTAPRRCSLWLGRGRSHSSLRRTVRE